MGDPYRAFRDDDDALTQGIITGLLARLDRIEDNLNELRKLYGIPEEQTMARRSETPTE